MPTAAPGYGAPAPRTNGLAVASLVLGIVGVLLCFFVLPSLLAVVFGLIGINQTKNNPAQGGRGMAIAGLVLGGVGLAIMLLLVIGNLASA